MTSRNSRDDLLDTREASLQDENKQGTLRHPPTAAYFASLVRENTEGGKCCGECGSDWDEESYCSQHQGKQSFDLCLAPLCGSCKMCKECATKLIEEHYK